MDLHRRSVLTGLVASSFCPLCPARAAVLEEFAEGGPDWNYDEASPKGPARWSELSTAYQACSIVSKEQSPVDLPERSGNIRAVLAQLPRLTIDWPSFPLELKNNGHAIEFSFPGTVLPQGTVTEERSSEFTLTGFHFHGPSEHKIGGRSFALEIHFVHVNRALNMLTVLGVFVEPQANSPDPELQKIWDKVVNPQSNLTVNPNLLLPTNRRRYRYAGSLTTPGCDERVHWNVFDTPIFAPPDLVKSIAGKYPKNARPVQGIWRRFLLADIWNGVGQPPP